MEAVPLLLAALAALASAILVPIWGAPDEPQHVQLVRLVAERGRWPTLEEVRSAGALQTQVYESMVSSGFWQRERHRTPPPSLTQDTLPDNLLPPLYARPAYYFAAALVLRPFLGASLQTQFYLLRGLSALLSLAAALCGFALARAAFASSPSPAWAAGIVIALLPMRTFLAASVNSDALAELVGAGALLLMVSSLRRRPTVMRIVGALALVGFGLLVKRTLVVLAPLSLLWLCLLWRRRAGAQRWRALVVLGLWLAVLAVSAFAWRGASTGADWPFPGRDPGSSLGVEPSYLARLWDPATWSPHALLALGLNLCLTLASFWGNFGWLTAPLPPGVYILLALLTGLAVAGVGRAAIRGWRQASDPNRAVWLLLVAATGLALAQLVGLALIHRMMQQGRYLFPVLGPVACLLVRGWSEWFPPGRRIVLIGLIAAGMAVLALGSWIDIILPHSRLG